MGLRIGVDVGGTFTDIIVLDEDTGQIRNIKLPSVPAAPEMGIVQGLLEGKVNLREMTMFLHGTTIGVNALIQGKLPRTALITTAGFGDILEIARINRPDMYNLLYKKPKPLVPRTLVFEVRERIGPDGEIRTPLAGNSVKKAIQALHKSNVAAVAVCLLHAYANPVHEKRIGQLLQENLPGVHVSLSHELTRHYYEYERTNTTVLNAALRPLLRQYLETLENRLKDLHYEREILISRSDGGVMTSATAKDKSVFTMQSGPASGVMAALELARQIGIGNVISIDVGGTSFDASIIKDGRPTIETTSQMEGYRFIVPNIEITNIGAGGGSIAWIDAGGSLQVGPMSAGADPGPICYGTGGEDPTVTDCALVIGYLDPTYFLGGRMRLDLDRAVAGLKRRIADPLGMDVHDAAAGVITVLERRMALKLREISIEKGYDPRDFTIIAFGGGGPMFAGAMSSALGCKRFVVPRGPGLFSAGGMLSLDIVHDVSQTFVTSLDRVKTSKLKVMIEKMKTDGESFVRAQLGKKGDVRLELSFDMRYSGQEHTVNVPSSSIVVSESTKKEIDEDFHKLHNVTYGYVLSEPVEIVNIRLRAIGIVSKAHLARVEKGSSEPSKGALKGDRKVFSPHVRREILYQVYDREKLRGGNRIRGPAILEELSSTTVVDEGQTLTVDRLGNCVVETTSEVS